MAKMTIAFDGLERLCKQLEDMSSTNTLRKVADEAMQKCFEQTQDALKSAMGKSPHNFDRTGETKAALKTDKKVEWNSPTTGSIGVGFDITGKNTGHSGLASIFLMYGTKVGGSPRVEPDRNLYNAIYGAAAKRKRKEICEDALRGALKQLKGG